ncbi:MAG: 30S ribosomal protein S15 [Candidatus Aureabacteria bacterium]|nr:30S ribosomal protein S15 [Candidatus Auribacterota bacterium]
MPSEKQDTIKKFAIHENDTGSTSVQIALLTNRINLLTNHLNVHKKDFSTRRSLLKLAGQRRKMMKYLNRKDPQNYKKVIEELDLRAL